MLRIGEKKVKCSTSCQQADVKPFESHSWNTEHCLNNRRWWESKIILHKIPNTAYRLNTAYIVTIASRNACMSTETNTRTISWNAFIQRGVEKAGLFRKDEMHQKNLSPNSLRDIRWHPYRKLKHSYPLLFNHFFPTY